MTIAVDTSAVIAVITNEPHKRALVDLTRGAELIVPASLHWEIGNAFSAMLKQRRVSLDQARQAIEAYQQMRLRSVDVPLAIALEWCAKLNIYAYDAYVLCVANLSACPLVTLDKGLQEAAARAGVKVLEFEA